MLNKETASSEVWISWTYFLEIAPNPTQFGTKLEIKADFAHAMILDTWYLFDKPHWVPILLIKIYNIFVCVCVCVYVLQNIVKHLYNIEFWKSNCGLCSWTTSLTLKNSTLAQSYEFTNLINSNSAESSDIISLKGVHVCAYVSTIF